jgi:hypothetical protein
VISFVNGYLCTSSCDVAKAKRGVDPHPKADPREADGKADKSDAIRLASELGDPAVVFGGSLSTLAPARVNATVAAQASNPARLSTPAPTIDLLV